MIIIQNKYSNIPVFKIDIDSEIKHVQTEQAINSIANSFIKFFDELDKDDAAMNKDLKNRIRNVIIVCGPFAISIFAAAFLKKPVALQIGAVLTGIGGGMLILTDKSTSLKEHLKKSKEKENINSNTVQDTNKTETTEDFLRNSSFNKTLSDNRLKYELAEYKKKMIQYFDQDNNLDKVESMQQVAKELDIYSYVYKLPTVNISNDDWDILFDGVYDLCSKKNMENDFYYWMSFLNRMAVANTLVYHKNKMNIYNYINALSYLDKKGLNEEEINNLKKDVMNELQSNNHIINYPKKTK